MLYYSATKSNFISSETALEVARRVLREHFVDDAAAQEPITVRAEGDDWIVEGRALPPVPRLPLEINIKRRAVIVISQFDGQIKDIVFNGPLLQSEP